MRARKAISQKTVKCHDQVVKNDKAAVTQLLVEMLHSPFFSLTRDQNLIVFKGV